MDDDEPWPCALARKQLSDLFLGNEAPLSAHLAWLIGAAARDLGLSDPSKLYRRFVRWTEDAQIKCGRCGKAGHRALPGLPPRLFPCELKQYGGEHRGES